MPASRGPAPSLPVALHRLLERYTPDGAGGRALFALASSSVGAFAFWMALVATFAISGIVWTIVGLLGWSISLAAVAVTVAVCWPIYLSLIGRLESATAYPDDGRRSRERSAVESGDEDDPLAVCKRRYAAGELTDAEFERRIDRLLDTDESRPAGRDRERSREIDDPERV